MVRNFSIISKFVKSTVVGFNNIREWLGVKGKKYRAKHGPLRDPKKEGKLLTLHYQCKQFEYDMLNMMKTNQEQFH